MFNLCIKAFRFLGGDRSEMDTGRPLPDESEWNTIVDKLAFSCPDVFPTHPGCIPSGVKRMSFINLPIAGLPGYRAHCVYFSHSITRTFWNVLCFAYRETECPLRALAAVPAEVWYSTAAGLTDDSQELSLASEGDVDLYPPLPACESTQAVFYRFPTTRGQLITRAADNWELCLEEAAKTASAPSHRSQAPPKPGWMKRLREKRSFFLFIGIIFTFIVLYEIYITFFSPRISLTNSTGNMAPNSSMPQSLPGETKDK